MKHLRFESPFTILLILLLGCGQSVYGQYGVRAKVNFERHHNLNDALRKSYGTNKNLFSPGYELGLDYWFKLKKKRIEFLPELAFSYGSTQAGSGVAAELNRFIFNFHTQIYALDLNEDCNCPTFSKQGPSINKGFFLHFTPGISYSTTTLLIDTDVRPRFTETPLSSNNITFHGGLGLGLDLGLNELVTITPMVSYFFHSSGLYDISKIEEETVSVETGFTQLQFQVRTGFRFDYKRSKYGRRR